MLSVEQSHHPLLVDSRIVLGRRRRTAHADRLTGQAPFAEELAGTEHRHDGFPAGLGEPPTT